MQFIATTATKRILKAKKRIRLMAGGMRAGKTIAILTILIDDAQTDKVPTLTSVVSESLPHLRRGALRDFETIMKGHGYWRDSNWHGTTFTYTFESGSKIEFFGADDSSKVRGPSRDRLFGNEVNNLKQETWEQLLYRTREYAYADWNPLTGFFMYDDYGLHDDDKVYSTDDRVDFMILTYKDNEALEPAIVEDIERKAAINQSWGRVYAQGKRGELEGKIFKGWQIIDSVPHEARLARRGLDFGYSNDPTALVDIYEYNGGYIFDELIYRKGMLNKQIADVILNQADPNVLTIADSAEPKSIDELTSYGVSVIGCQKGPGSVKQRIQYVQGQKISITKRSVNLIKSYRNFMWKTDKEGKILNEYDHFWSDGMMAASYGMEGFKPYEEEEIESYETVTNFTF